MTSVFSIEAISAGKGDSLVLYFGRPDKPALIVVDGGLMSTWTGPLRRRLRELHGLLGLGQGERLPLHLVAVSHLDDDHINGIVRMVRDEVEARQQGPGFVEILQLWNNTFDDVIGALPNVQTVTSALASRSSGGHDGASVLTSFRRGRELRDGVAPLRQSGLVVNPPVGADHNLMASTGGPTLTMGPLEITVVGPMQEQLDELQEEWDAFLEASGHGTEAEAALAASRLDKSVTNLASIVMLVACEGRTILLTGDARGDLVLEGLEKAGILPAGGELALDVLKVPHHGSPGNSDEAFFRRLPARSYIFSGNGSHGNPDRITLERLVAARGDAAFEVHFTYELAEIDVERREHFEQHGQNWSDGENGLIAWAEATAAAHPGIAIRIGSETAPHEIRLGAAASWAGT